MLSNAAGLRHNGTTGNLRMARMRDIRQWIKPPRASFDYQLVVAAGSRLESLTIALR